MFPAMVNELLGLGSISWFGARLVILVGGLCGICRQCRHVGECWRFSLSFVTCHDVIEVVLLST
jgi:hypothetical protein